MKTGLILEGGALRGVFTAGVLDRLMESEIYLPYVVGVSAGGGNAMSYCSHQQGRTVRLMTAPSEETYYGFRQFLASHRLINLDKMCYEYPYKQFPLDFKSYFGSGIEAEYVCTCCETGEAEYLTEQRDEKRLLTICKATCSVPMLCSPVELDGKHYLDGSIADSIPIERALSKGCDRLVIVLTKPESNVAPTDYRIFKGVLQTIYKDYPRFVEKCLERVDNYDRTARLMQQLKDEGRVLVIRPQTEPISKFEHDYDKITDFYRHGYDLADSRISEIMQWCGIADAVYA
ncbi:MAG: patatin family protein [Oscillospiraceae bacterium]